MRTSWEPRLREDLRELAEVPGVDSPADRALAGARTVRRRRLVLAVAGPAALAILVAFPMVTQVPSFFGFGGTAPCETTTDEANPPQQSPVWKQPRFVRAVLAKLPSRDDYYLQSAHGICAEPGYLPRGYAVVNLGPYREHGHLTITIYYHSHPRTCAAMSEPKQPTLFCEEGTDTTPLVMAQNDGANSIIVFAIYPDTRAVSLGSHETPFNLATLRSAATAPDLIDLLP